MGFGPVSVPEGCEVATVKAVLEASDYYMMSCGFGWGAQVYEAG
jgi:hypothetical protein